MLLLNSQKRSCGVIWFPQPKTMCRDDGVLKTVFSFVPLLLSTASTSRKVVFIVIVLESFGHFFFYIYSNDYSHY